MVFGIQASKDIRLSQVARALDKPVTLKKTEERLSRNIQTEGLDAKLNQRIAAEGAKRIKPDTLISVDPTDIRKEYTRKMPHPQRSMTAVPGCLGRNSVRPAARILLLIYVQRTDTRNHAKKRRRILWFT